MTAPQTSSNPEIASGLSERYEPAALEERWQQCWVDQNLYATEEPKPGQKAGLGQASIFGPNLTELRHLPGPPTGPTPGGRASDRLPSRDKEQMHKRA